MKLNIKRAEFLRALQRTATLISQRPVAPILGQIKLQATDGALRLTATDMEIEGTAVVAADVEERGETTFPGRHLLEIAKRLAGDTVAINGEVVKAGRSRFKLAELPAGDYPDMAVREPDATIKISGADLQDLLRGVRFATSNEETRYYLRGVYLHSHDGKLRAVATDGHRLACVDAAVPADFSGVIVPRKTVDEILRMVPGAEDVTLEVSPTHVSVSTDTGRLTSKLIDATYPDYKKVIPEEGASRIDVDASELIAAVERAAIVAGEDKARPVKLTVSGDELRVEGSGANSGEFVEDLRCESTFAGKISFNARYLLDILGACDEDVAHIYVTDGAAPARFRAERGFYVFMPMRV